MNVFMYRAALYCEPCGEAIAAVTPKPPGFDSSKESTWDSDDYPKGPYGEGGGEADTAQHCDACGLFLENPLTAEGRRHVLEALREHFADGRGSADVLRTWVRHYGITLDEYAGPLARPPGIRVMVFDDDGSSGPHDLGVLDMTDVHAIVGAAIGEEGQ